MSNQETLNVIKAARMVAAWPNRLHPEGRKRYTALVEAIFAYDVRVCKDAEAPGHDGGKQHDPEPEHDRPDHHEVDDFTKETPNA